MFGPMPRGHWTTELSVPASEQFVRGERYSVVRLFTDYDQSRHAPGEMWTFLGSSFQPYDDGMSWFVSLDGRQEWQIRLLWRPEAQAPVLDRPSDYLRPCEGARA